MNEVTGEQWATCDLTMSPARRFRKVWRTDKAIGGRRNPESKTGTEGTRGTENEVPVA